MLPRCRAPSALGFAALVILSSVVYGGTPGIWRTERILQKDDRVTKDRLHDEAFLDAVGAVWPYPITRSATGYDAATGHDAASGFLIDRCHVLTNMHVVYTDATVVDPPVGQRVTFAVGQTKGGKDRGALQGLKFLLAGTVVAHGDSIIVDHWVHNPDDDWALIRLGVEVDDSIVPMTIAAIDLARLPSHFMLATAGFPTDHREMRGDGFRLKDLWGSDGQLVGVVATNTAGAVIETTIQTTPGDSGGPVYGDFNGRRHIVVGMVQGIRGNGIDVSESMPNIQVLFTPSTIARVAAAEAQTPCQ
jgi:V8-like Glu-specific endopeptidase